MPCQMAPRASIMSAAIKATSGIAADSLSDQPGDCSGVGPHRAGNMARVPARAAAALGKVMAREQKSRWNQISQWSMRLGVLIALAAVLTACGSQPESAPATTAPAATTEAPASAPATTAADEEDEAADDAGGATAVAADEGMASPVASPVVGAATPVGMIAATPEGMVAATPIGAGEMLASPVAGAAEATPERRNRENKATPVGEVAMTAEDCAAYLAWQDDAGVQAALAYTADWPLVVAEGEKLAAGEPIDTEAMQALATELDGQANVLRESDSEDLDHDTVAYAARAMGLASRLAAGMADGTRTEANVGDLVAEVKSAIARFEEDTAARQAACA